MATSPSSKPENNNGVPVSVLEFLQVDDAVNMSSEQSDFMDSFAHHSGNLLDQTIMLSMVEPLGVFPSPSTLSEAFLNNKGVFDHAFSEPRSGAEVDPASVRPLDAAFINSITLTQTPPSPPPPSNHPIPSPSPLPLPPPPSDQTIASPPLPQSDQATTSTPLPPPPPSQSEKPKVISAKRKRGQPRKEFTGERSGVEGRVEEASQEKKKRRMKKKNKQGEAEAEGKQPAPSFASPSPSTSPSPSVLFNHPNSTVLGFSSCQNVIQPASIIASQNEDISAKIISFALNNGAVFVLAASGQLSSLRYMEPSGIVQELTGVYEILSLSGTLMLSNEGEAPAQRSRTGYLTISVVGMDGKIIGGQVCGSMIAASPVQVVGGAIVAATNDGKDSANEKDKELRQAKQELEETRKLLNQTRQKLQETRLIVSTNQNLLMQLFERLNIVNPPPPPPSHSSTNNPPSSL